MKKVISYTVKMVVDEKDRRLIAEYTGSDPDKITLDTATDEFVGTLLTAISDAHSEMRVGIVEVKKQYEWYEG